MPNLVEVKGVAADSQTEYTLPRDGASAAAVTTRRKLQVLDLVSGRMQSMRLDVISNKKLTDSEGDALIAMSRAARFPTPAAVARQLEERERMLGDVKRGFATSVVVNGVEEQWGAATHSAAVLLRSWRFEATPVGGVADSAGACEEKYRGEYHFLLLNVACTAPDGSVSSMFTLPLQPADAAWDEQMPEMTAYRACRFLLEPHPSASDSETISFAVFRTAVLCVPYGMDSDGTTADVHAGVLANGGSPDDDRPQKHSCGRFHRHVPFARQLYVVDIDRIMRAESCLGQAWLQSLEARWAAALAGGRRVATSLFPNGLAFVPESALASVFGHAGDAAGTDGDAASYLGVRFDPVVVAVLRRMRAEAAVFPRRRGNVMTLYHGTGPSREASIRSLGFLRSRCHRHAQCLAGNCECQMEGFGVYFAELDKATQYACRLKEPESDSPDFAGVVFECLVDLGHMKLASRKPCPHGCGKDFVDHCGTWYAHDGFDSLMVPDDSMPATRTKEWCVADPSRITIVSARRVVFHRSKTIPLIG